MLSTKMYYFPILIALLFSPLISSSQIISQYVDTDSGTTPKGIEIWNNTGSDLDFSSNNLIIEKGTNGAAPSVDITVSSGTLGVDEVMVIGSSDIETYLTNTFGQNEFFFVEKPFTFNGDDALQVIYNGDTTDIFGTPGVDPGSSWDGNGVSTSDQNIKLLTSISNGDTTGWSDPSTRYETVSTSPTSAGGLEDFGRVPCTTPTDISGEFSFPGNQEVELYWENGLCYDEILVVAKAGSSVTATPSGDGSSITANQTFGSGTDIGTNEYAVYKGSLNETTITGLTNNTTFYFKIFARKGTSWSSGVSLNETPIELYSFFDEPFDDNTQYSVTAGGEGNDGTADYFQRTDGSNINISYNGFTGDFYAAQDVDDGGWTGSANPSTLTWSNINITAFSDLTFSGLFASSSQNFIDNSDYVNIEYQIDGGGWNNLLFFRNEGSTFNTYFLEDTDFNGTGDGRRLTSYAKKFNKSIPATGDRLDLRITVAVNSGDEDFAFDSFKLLGTPNGLIYVNNSWTPNPPDGTTGSDNAAVLENTATINSNATIDQIVVKKEATLEIAGNALTVNTFIENNGNVMVRDDAAIIQTGSTDNNTGIGTYTVERTGGSSASAYNGWSTPIDGVSLHDNSGVFSSSNPCDIFAFDGSDQSWKYDFPTNYSTTCNGNGVTFTSQFLISGADGNMDAARGYLIPGNATSTRSFSGNTINNGDFTYSLGTGTNPNDPLSNWSDDYWNLIGNPYPSAIDVSSFLTANSSNLTTSAVYVWSDDGTSGSGYTESDYITVNSSGSTGAVNGSNITNGNIASTQGFFVQGTGSGGNITFTNSMRTTGNDQFRSSQSLPRFWLSLNDNRISSQLLIAFPGDASDEFEKNYDAPRYYGQNHLNISSQLPADSSAMVIQGMETVGVNDEKEIALLVELDKMSEVSFQLDSIELIDENTKILLKDRQLDSLIDIKTNSYTTTLDSGKYNARFSIILNTRFSEIDAETSEDSSVINGLNEKIESNLKVFYSRSNLVVQNNTSSTIEQVNIYDVQGKEVFNSTQNKKIYTPKIQQAGFYISVITLQNGNSKKTKFTVK
ncbi:T9SS type A sorting domain-containing protein [Salibacter halophilus]|uniref:T9SS type A sorting domain-containing protein n=1 Tax=Salibacter halophilus TaxID=1803916 RepID=A0A6N6M7A2_9FLAO|nr:T9SS type A sorting domain-containing protein [Salibacter halophilus]KAB1063678.1 T9SS type A sorting domain-containing protein [Salibacter halophilus]